MSRKGGGRAKTFLYVDTATETWAWRCNACPVGTYRGYVNRAHANSDRRLHESRDIHKIMLRYLAHRTQKRERVERLVHDLFVVLCGPSEEWGPRLARLDPISERTEVA